jgi:monoamine oxidase
MARSLYSLLRHRFGSPVSLEDRRAFLRASITTGAGLMVGGTGLAGLAGCAAQATRDGRAGAGGTAEGGNGGGGGGGRAGRSLRIVIIGGGFAGLAAAHELVKSGHEPIVLEGRQRVGGRVMSFRNFVPGKIVEGGGELVGSNHPLWQAYASEFGLEMLDLVEDEHANAPIVLGGKRLSNDEAASLWEELDSAANQMNALAASIDADEPWTSSGAAELDARSLSSWIDALDVSPVCKHALAAQFAGDNGVANESASLLAMLAAVKGGGLENYWTESEVYRCKGGNDQLADKLAERIGSHRLRPGTRVLSVEQHAHGVRIGTEHAGIVEGDAAIVAVAPTIWPAITFSPGLPESLSGLKSPQMGVNVKYLARVRSRFWIERGDGPDALTDGEVTWTWDATNNQDPERTDAPACLTAFSGGPAAARARARVEADRRAAYAKTLETIHPGFAQAYEADRFMDWPADPWTRAGYSFAAPHQLTRSGRVLREGLEGGRIMLAGEHCCPAFPGYMEGALQSGVHAAKRLAGASVAAAR